MAARPNRLPLLIVALGVLLVVVVVMRVTGERAAEAPPAGAAHDAAPAESAAETATARPVETAAVGAATSARTEVAPIPKPSLSFDRALSGLVGRVVETEGAPVKGAAVELIGGTVDVMSSDFERALFEPESFTLPLKIFKTATDADGRFRFEHVDPRGFFLLGVNLGAPRPQLRMVDRMPRAGETVDLGDVPLDPPLALKGRVVDDRGRAVAGARVRATNLPSIVFQAGVANVSPGAALLLLHATTTRAIVFEIPKWVDPYFAKLPMPAATTDGEGRFTIDGAPAGALTLLVDGGDLPAQFKGPIPSSKGEKDVGEIAVSRGDDVEGRVVDENGAPVAQAELRVGVLAALSGSDVAFLRRPIRAGADGAFAARGVTGNAIYVVARAPGVAGWSISPKIELAGDPITVTVAAPRSVLVRVKGADGKPMAATVAAQRDVRRISIFSPFEPALAAKTELVEPGAYRVSGLVAGAYSVLARAEGFATASAKVQVEAAGEPEVALTLEPERKVHVTVLGKEDGKPGPLEGATVVGAPKELESAGGLRALSSARTDARGEAVVKALGTGKLSILGSHPGYAMTRVEVEIPGASAATIAMLVGGSIDGRVRRGTSAPEKPVMVVCVERGRDAVELPRFAVTDSDGAFRFTHVSPGSYHVAAAPRLLDRSLTQVGSVIAEMGGGDPFDPLATARVDVRDEETTTVDLQLDPTAVVGEKGSAGIRGVVTRNGAPLARAEVVAGGVEWKMTRTDDQGRFVMRGLKPGRYDVNVSLRREGMQANFGGKTVTLQSGDEPSLEFTFRTAGPIRGVVRSAVTGGPLEKATIYAFPSRPDPRGESSPSQFFSARTDASGAFEIEDVVVGTYGVQATASGHQTGRVNDVAVADGAPPDPIELKLGAGIVASGRVTAAGLDQANWVGLNFSGKPPTMGQGWTQIDPKDPAFRIDTLAPGRYWAMLNAAGESPASSFRFRMLEVDVPESGVAGLDLKFEKETGPVPTFSKADDGK